MENQLTTYGLVFLVSAWLVISGLVAFSLYKVYATKK